MIFPLVIFTIGALTTGRGPLPFFASVADVWYRQYARISYLWVVPLVALSSVAIVSFFWSAGSSFAQYLGGTSFKRASKKLFQKLSALGLTLLLFSGAATLSYFIWREGVRSTIRFATTTFQVIGALSDEDRILGSSVELQEIDGALLAEFNTGVGIWWSDYSVETTAASYLSSKEFDTSRSLLLQLAVNVDEPIAIQAFRESGFGAIVVNERMLGERIGPAPGQFEVSDSWIQMLRGDTVSVWVPA